MIVQAFVCICAILGALFGEYRTLVVDRNEVRYNKSILSKVMVLIMIRCINCGVKLDDEMMVCPLCDAYQIICQECGALQWGKTKACSQCGAKLKAVNAESECEEGPFGYRGSKRRQKHIDEDLLMELARDAECGDAAAQKRMGDYYSKGRLTRKNAEPSFYWYQKAAEQGDSGAQVMLGECYARGRGTEKDLVKDFYWYREAARQGNIEAEYRVAKCYYMGHGVTKDIAEAVKIFFKLARVGHADAQRCLGDCYFYGKGIEQNFDEADYWYRSAGKNGALKIDRRLKKLNKRDRQMETERNRINRTLRADLATGADLTCEGFDVPLTDFSQVVAWHTKRGEQGNIESQLKLAHYYMIGIGVPKDEKTAFSWYKMVAEQGDASAQAKLGELYYKGQGTEADVQEAVFWFRKGAEQGDASAQYGLAQCYRKGSGVEADEGLARIWYQQAAEQGHRGAKGKLMKKK